MNLTGFIYWIKCRQSHAWCDHLPVDLWTSA